MSPTCPQRLLRVRQPTSPSALGVAHLPITYGGPRCRPINLCLRCTGLLALDFFSSPTAAANPASEDSQHLTALAVSQAVSLPSSI